MKYKILIAALLIILAFLISADTARASEIENNVNVLVLGLDSRHNVTSTRCDAIHMLSFDTQDWKITITSVPRGTYTYIKGQPQSQSYLANACSLLGINETKKRIEKIVGIKADYTMTVGFSQTYGILRQLKMPTAESLQWLRNRKAFGIGDPQRSRNHSVFIKDLILKHIDRFGSILTLPIEKSIFSFINTDMDFKTARALLVEFKNSKISKDPGRIQLVMKPYYKTKDYHFNFDNPYQSLKSVGAIAGPINPIEKQKGLDDEQQKIVTHIKNSINKKMWLKDTVKKQLWRQIEDIDTREELHFTVVKKYAATQLNTVEKKIDFVSDYIVEKEGLGLYGWADEGKKLMEQITE